MRQTFLKSNLQNQSMHRWKAKHIRTNSTHWPFKIAHVNTVGLEAAADCRKCLQKGQHKTADCPNPVKCRQCLANGHRAGDNVSVLAYSRSEQRHRCRRLQRLLHPDREPPEPERQTSSKQAKQDPHHRLHNQTAQEERWIGQSTDDPSSERPQPTTPEPRPLHP